MAESHVFARRLEAAENAPFAVVAIGSSAGGVQALSALLAGLSPDFSLPILVCHHVLRDRPTLLPAILARRTRLRVALAKEGVRPAPRSIYIAPPNRHMLVRPDGRLDLSDAERINWCRPRRRRAVPVGRGRVRRRRHRRGAHRLRARWGDGQPFNPAARRVGHRPGRGDGRGGRHATGRARSRRGRSRSSARPDARRPGRTRPTRALQIRTALDRRVSG